MQSGIDSAIYGIIYRLNLLPFIAKTTQSCSGHVYDYHGRTGKFPDLDGDYLPYNRFIEEGYLLFSYLLEEADNKRDSESLHRILAETTAEEIHQGSRYTAGMESVDDEDGHVNPDFSKADWGLGFEKDGAAVQLFYVMRLCLPEKD